MVKIKTLIKIEAKVVYGNLTPHTLARKLIGEAFNNELIKVQQTHELHQIVEKDYCIYNKAWTATLLVSEL